MLEGLDDIPWERLCCAVGHAGHVPAAVRSLLSEDLSVVRSAYWRLDNSVVLQSDLYEAAAYLPPFLIKILDHARHSEPILDLLFEIGNGYGPPDDPALRVRCRREVITGLDAWLGSSGRQDPSLRAAVENCLAELGDDEDA